MRESTMRVLVVHARYTDRLSYYDDWLDAFRSSPKFHVGEFNVVPAGQDAALHGKLGSCDAVVLLHSTNGDTTVYLERYAAILAARNVPLLSFVGNEVNLPGSPIAEKRRVLSIVRPDWIATQLLQEAGEFLFGDVAGRGVVSIPHALNPDQFRIAIPSDQRPIDIGARVARYLAHLGDDDRNRISDAFRSIGPQKSLVIDISNERYDRDGWASFLNRCKGTISTEAGGWFLERDDATVNAIRAYVLQQAGGVVIANDSPLRTLGHRLPWWIRAALRRILGAGPVRHEAVLNERVPYEEIHERFFAGRTRPAVYGKCISSRHFDAVGTGTCQIMFRGRFNDILEPDRHYLALDPDFSNFDLVLARFLDPSERGRIADDAREHVLSGHTYAHRMDQIHLLLSATS